MKRIRFTIKPKRKYNKFFLKYDIPLIILILFIVYLVFGLLHSFTYDLDTNCCRHMSMRIEDKLESIGIDVKIVTGDNVNKSDSGHMWIEVSGIQFDSVCLFPYKLTGQNYVNITKYDDFKDYIKYKEDRAGKDLEYLEDVDQGPLFDIDFNLIVLSVIFCNLIYVIPLKWRW